VMALSTKDVESSSLDDDDREVEMAFLDCVI